MRACMVVRRADLRQLDWIDQPALGLGSGQLRLRVDSFALTANNITYAAFGDAMNYWDFFPTGDASTGCIPVWGFADVLESNAEGIDPGERLYGYWPIAETVILEPARVTATAFFDGAAHRRELHAVYNQYLRTRADPACDARLEAQQALLRPLFTTSFLIDDFLASEQFFGASAVLLSSASSKTAYGAAFCLAQRRSTADAVKLIGLTSSANLAFTRSLGCYDEVFTYDEVNSLGVDRSAVYVDFSGNAALRLAVHRRLADRLVYSCSVGGTHWQELGGGQGLPGPRPVLFFAPARIRQRVTDWGHDGLQARLATAWEAFMEPVARGAEPWLRVRRGHGAAAIETCYLDLLNGRSDPRDGHFLSF
ncbi:MAG: DUF2855 family protein [Ideonella sp.]